MSAEWQSLVLQFTKGAEFEVPEKPKTLTYEQFEFISQMMSDELNELGRGLNESSEEMKVLKQCDAFIDMIYYLLDTANRMGWNLDKLFKLVHIANMQKVADGVVKSDSGKVMKPKGWKSADSEMIKMIQGYRERGSWEGSNGQKGIEAEKGIQQ